MKRIEIESVNYGYIVKSEGKTPYVFKSLEETQLLEFIAKEVLDIKVKVELR